jgi:hypothetical protein
VVRYRAPWVRPVIGIARQRVAYVRRFQPERVPALRSPRLSYTASLKNMVSAATLLQEIADAKPRRAVKYFPHRDLALRRRRFTSSERASR